MINVAEPLVGEEEFEAVKEVLMSGMYVSGKTVKKFEEEFANYIGTEYAVAVNSGTSALHLSLMALGVEPGDEVIVPALTFFSTISAVIYVGAIPVFADLDENYCMDLNHVKTLINEKTKAIIPVHYFGYMVDILSLTEMVSHTDIVIIEDAAQAHGASFDDHKAGSLGMTGCFSFFATKNMNTMGEGGMITTNSKTVADYCRLARAHGMTDRNTHRFLGYNYRMTEIEAAFGLVQLKKLPIWNSKRDYNSMYILNNLRDLNWIKISKYDTRVNHAWFWCPIQLKNREDIEPFKEYLKKNGIGFRHRYDEPLYKQPALEDCGLDYKDVYLPKAEEVCGCLFGLPNHPNMNTKQLNEVIQVVRSFKS